jgi:hypothetical protein
VAFHRLLGEDAVAVYLHFEDPAGGFDKLDLGIREGATDLGRQTGGPGLVISDDAEFDSDSHRPTIAALDTPRHTAELARILFSRKMLRPA